MCPNEIYKTPTDVPTKLRQKIIEQHESGVEPVQLSELHNICIEWIELFVAEIQGEG